MEKKENGEAADITIFKCDICGRFVSGKNLEEGEATRVLVTPDSAFTNETYETICRKCNRTTLTFSSFCL